MESSHYFAYLDPHELGCPQVEWAHHLDEFVQGEPIDHFQQQVQAVGILESPIQFAHVSIFQIGKVLQGLFFVFDMLYGLRIIHDC